MRRTINIKWDSNLIFGNPQGVEDTLRGIVDILNTMDESEEFIREVNRLVNSIMSELIENPKEVPAGFNSDLFKEISNKISAEEIVISFPENVTECAMSYTQGMSNVLYRLGIENVKIIANENVKKELAEAIYG